MGRTKLKVTANFPPELVDRGRHYSLKFPKILENALKGCLDCLEVS